MVLNDLVDSFCYSQKNAGLKGLISDIRALWRSGLSARVPECQKLKNGRLDLNDAEHSNCNRMMTLGFKGLSMSVSDLTATDAPDMHL